MTDTLNQSAPAWHTTSPETKLAAARDEIVALTDRLRWAEHCRSQAEESLADAKAGTLAAQEATQAEADRADGAEAHLLRVLAHYVVEPATEVLSSIGDGVDTDDVPSRVLEDIADDLRDELGVGLTLDELDERACLRLREWAEESR